MKFEDLKKLQGIDTAIELKEHEIATLRARPLSTVPELSGIPKGVGVSDIVGDGLGNIYVREPKLQGELALLRRKKAELEKYISSIDDITVRSAIEQFVYHGRTWQNIALRFNYSESGIRYKVKAYMERRYNEEGKAFGFSL